MSIFKKILCRPKVNQLSETEHYNFPSWIDNQLDIFMA